MFIYILTGFLLSAVCILLIALAQSHNNEERLKRYILSKQREMNRLISEVYYYRGKEIGRDSDYLYRQLQKDLENGRRIVLPVKRESH